MPKFLIAVYGYVLEADLDEADQLAEDLRESCTATLPLYAVAIAADDPSIAWLAPSTCATCAHGDEDHEPDDKGACLRCECPGLLEQLPSDPTLSFDCGEEDCSDTALKTLAHDEYVEYIVQNYGEMPLLHHLEHGHGQFQGMEASEASMVRRHRTAHGLEPTMK